MRTVLIILLFLNTSLAWTQGRAKQGSIQFNELVHSFGIIEEKDGGVFHNFHFQNKGNSDVILTDIYTGCSCSAGSPADTVLSPGEESFIQVAYYPKNRPGTFVKSVRIDFMTDSTAFSRYLNIKGFVADEKASQIASSQEQASYSIRLAPLRIKVMALNDTLVTHRSEIIDFINAITYVIDADKFVNLKLTLTYHQSARKE